jgi:hypothetical protein
MADLRENLRLRKDELCNYCFSSTDLAVDLSCLSSRQRSNYL